MSCQIYKLIISIFVIVDAVTSRTVTSLQADRQKRSDDLGLQPVIEQHAQQLSSLKAEIAALKARTASLSQSVAFYAWSDNNPVHVPTNTQVILSHAATNVGHAYDPTTGIFTVPVAGLYDFQASCMNFHRDSSDPVTRCAIYVDYKLVAVSISDSRHGYYDQGTMKAVVHANAGQRVSLKNIDAKAHDYFDMSGLPYTTFSGFLIKAD